VQFSNVEYILVVVKQISRTFSPCKAELESFYGVNWHQYVIEKLLKIKLSLTIVLNIYSLQYLLYKKHPSVKLKGRSVTVMEREKV